MQVVRNLAELTRGRPAILTIGGFDGVHRGHQFLIRQVVDRARRLDYDSVVVTFDPRPQVVLRPGNKQLTAADAKLRILSALGASIVVVLPFTRELSQIPAGQFLLKIREHINLAEIWVGSDFAFGHNREGNVDFLIHSGQQSGYSVHVVSRQDLDGKTVSSTAVREIAEAGDVSEAAFLLGHYLRVPGEVVHGAGRGRELGFPTANLAVSPSQVVPATGIYAAYAILPDGPDEPNGSTSPVATTTSGGENDLQFHGSRFSSDDVQTAARAVSRSNPTAAGRLSAAVSVGTNPTFGEHDLSIEAYLLDFEGDLSGRRLCLDFVRRIRDEAAFERVEDLITQMKEDVEQTRHILSQAQEPGELIL
jgi:riboflavin kinase / FMN adenylyltransferase